MALDYTFTPRQQVLTPTEILILSSISFIKSTPHTNQTDFEHVLAIVNAGRFTHYDENINILFYLYSLALYQDHHFQKAFAIANQGIDWLSNHDSHYMLADLFLLVAKTATALNDPQAATAASLKSDTLAEIFNQSRYHF
ncbi:hypothetical protein [Latilactobacillus curvatus]